MKRKLGPNSGKQVGQYRSEQFPVTNRFATRADRYKSDLILIKETNSSRQGGIFARGFGSCFDPISVKINDDPQVDSGGCEPKRGFFLKFNRLT